MEVVRRKKAFSKAIVLPKIRSRTAAGAKNGLTEWDEDNSQRLLWRWEMYAERVSKIQAAVALTP